MPGKHTEQELKVSELKKVIERKDREIRDIKNSLAEVLQDIRNINESNDYNNREIIKRKISELCTDTIYELLIDEKMSQFCEHQSKN